MLGGFGNQLYSYAAGLAISKRARGDLRFDVRDYSRQKHRKLEVGAFGLPVVAWSPVMWKLERLARDATRGRWRPGPERVTENGDFDPSLLSVSAPCYIKGSCQSWRYFEGIQPEIRSAFDTDKLVVPRVAAWEKRIHAASCAVMIHLRLGDFEGIPGFVLGRDYFERAIEHMNERVSAPTYFLFSDDIPKAMSLIGRTDVVPVSGFDTLEDFRLMSLCRHFITANSTFSWWAAWLGRAADKIIVTPSRWFGGSDAAMDARIPPDWVRL